MCCIEGRVFHDEYPQLQPLPNEYADVLLQNHEHFSKYGAFYNKILCIGSTSVENGRNDAYEQIRCESGVKLNGHTTHYLHKVNGTLRAGKRYFTFDNTDEM